MVCDLTVDYATILLLIIPIKPNYFLGAVEVEKLTEVPFQFHLSTALFQQMPRA